MFLAFGQLLNYYFIRKLWCPVLEGHQKLEKQKKKKNRLEETDIKARDKPTKHILAQAASHQLNL